MIGLRKGASSLWSSVISKRACPLDNISPCYSKTIIKEKGNFPSKKSTFGHRYRPSRIHRLELQYDFVGAVHGHFPSVGIAANSLR